MHAIAYWGLLLALFVSLFAAGVAAWQSLAGRREALPWLEGAHYVATAFMTVSSMLLLIAFVRQDYGLKYVYDYSDSTLELFYAVTAFWAGQDGSLLFWAWLIALMGLAFQVTPGYRSMPGGTRTAYWLLFLVVQAFFLLLLTCWSDPFVEIVPPPLDGRGLNPLLRNPGMIFHPPLLFLGYAGFTIPACLALATRLSGEGWDWLPVGRRWNLFSWIFLTAGIVLGGWWAYMELGWGGYWAWDPVENASLLPWFTSSALIHTAIVQERRKALYDTNVFLIALSFLICVFATYLVRSGVVQSLHAFGGSGVELPLVIFMLAALVLITLTSYATPSPQGRELPGIVSRPGFLVLAAWMFLALGVVVSLGTMWPVISSLWSENTVGLDAAFYNRVCMPLFTVIALLLVFCPWLGWKEGLKDRAAAIATMAALPLGAAFMVLLGYSLPLAAIGGGAGVAALVGMALVAARDESYSKHLRGIGFIGVHAGLALVVLGVAVSGPFSQSLEVALMPGQKAEVDGYEFTYAGLDEFETEAMGGIRARITITRGGAAVGEVRPERRIYRGFDQPFAEVSTIFSMGKEVYSVLLGLDKNDRASFKLAVNPLVNWVWLGTVIMCLAGFLCMTGGRRAMGSPAAGGGDDADE